MIDQTIEIATAATAAAVTAKKVRDKKTGKSGCGYGCGCEGCISKGQCH